jgi:hypothetical protein
MLGCGRRQVNEHENILSLEAAEMVRLFRLSIRRTNNPSIEAAVMSRYDGGNGSADRKG